MTRSSFEYAFETPLGNTQLFLLVEKDRWVWRIFERGKDYRFSSLEQVFDGQNVPSRHLVVASSEGDSHQYEVQVVKLLDELQFVFDQLGIRWVRFDGRRLVGFLPERDMFVLCQYLSRSLVPASSFECRFVKTLSIPVDEPDLRAPCSELLNIFFAREERPAWSGVLNGISVRRLWSTLWKNISRIFRLWSI